MSLKNVKNVVSAKASAVKASAEAAVASMGEVLQPRQKKSKADVEEGGSKKTMKTPSFDIRLPRPTNGSQIYTPQEAATNLYHAEQNLERLCGSANKNTQRSFLSQYKQAMIKDKLVPVKITALNELHAKKYGQEGQPCAPPFWNMKGRPDIKEQACGTTIRGLAFAHPHASIAKTNRLEYYTIVHWPSPKAHRVCSQGRILSTSQVFPSREDGMVCLVACQCMLV
jgi:hypothetical protein